MGCFSSQERPRSPQNRRFAKGTPRDISLGPLTHRRCTDIICLGIFIVHWLAFLVLAILGTSEGDPRKLYRPRDFRGGFCGIPGTSHEFQTKLVQAMNVSAVADSAVKQLVCSSAANEVLEAAWGPSSPDYLEYLCNCCLKPCSRCEGSLKLFNLRTGAQVEATISARMAELRDPSKAAYLFSPSSVSAAYFNGADLLTEATKYLVPVCLSGSCSVSGRTQLAGSRNYTFSPLPDSPYKRAWDQLAAGGRGRPAAEAQAIQSTIQTQFTFKAMPLADCPYPEQYCVPMPGVKFADLPGDYCAPELEDSVVGAVGAAAAQAMAGLGYSSLAEAAGSQAGSAFGDMMSTLDVLAMVTFWGFIVGLLFLVLLRFFVGCAVWASLVAVFVILLLGGWAAFARSTQCKGDGLFETGSNQATAVAITAHSTVTSGAAVNEELTGNGADYRGRQQRTRSGRLCQRWDCVTTEMAAATGATRTCVHDHDYSPSAYSSSDLLDNFCRNPARADSIWCLTGDLDMRWELCSPIGVLVNDCQKGFAVAGETSRKVLKICAFVVWGFAAAWVLLVACMYRRIKLVIALNKVAAMFLYSVPSVIMVPVIQVVVGAVFFIVWVWFASFIISHVPSDYTPTGYYATYEEAYGTANTTGACTDKWPSGFVWKYAGNVSAADDPCSGNLGDTTGITPRCWRCAPPRFVVGVKFGYALFSLLWNQAMGIAVGQCIIAGACAIWFFTPRGRKMPKPALPKAVRNTFRYHLGSLAFGSFVIALVQFIRYCLLYLEKQAKAQKNKVMEIVLKAVQCCIWLFEKLLKFITKNAFIQVAIMGTSFCTSARTAVYLMMRNAARFGALAILGSIIHFIGFAIITSVTALVGYFIVQAFYPEVSPAMPVVSYIAVGYLIAQLYMNVFGMSVDTTLQCFIAAEEMEDNSFVPSPLLSLVPSRKAFDSEEDGSKYKARGRTMTSVVPD